MLYGCNRFSIKFTNSKQVFDMQYSKILVLSCVFQNS